MNKLIRNSMFNNKANPFDDEKRPFSKQKIKLDCKTRVLNILCHRTDFVYDKGTKDLNQRLDVFTLIKTVQKLKAV